MCLSLLSAGNDPKMRIKEVFKGIKSTRSKRMGREITADLRPQTLLEGGKQNEKRGELKNLKTKCLLGDVSESKQFVQQVSGFRDTSLGVWKRTDNGGGRYRA